MITFPVFAATVALFLGLVLAVRAAERLSQPRRLRVWR